LAVLNSRRQAKAVAAILEAAGIRRFLGPGIRDPVMPEHHGRQDIISVHKIQFRYHSKR